MPAMDVLTAGAPVDVSWDVPHGVVVAGEREAGEDDGDGTPMTGAAEGRGR